MAATGVPRRPGIVRLPPSGHPGGQACGTGFVLLNRWDVQAVTVRSARAPFKGASSMRSVRCGQPQSCAIWVMTVSGQAR